MALHTRHVLTCWEHRVTGVKTAGDQNIVIVFCHSLTLSGSSTNRELNPQDHLISNGGLLLTPFTISRDYQGAPIGTTTLHPHKIFYLSLILYLISYIISLINPNAKI